MTKAPLPTLELGSTGPAVEAAKIGVNHWRRRNGKTAGNTSRVFGVFFREWVKDFQKRNAILQSGVIGPATWLALLPYIPSIDKLLLLGYKPPSWENIGSVVASDVSVLDHDCTHATSGLPLYPAFDTAFGAGRKIVAPEDMEATKASHSTPGLAFYAIGESGLRYWFGHLDRTHLPGERFSKGQFVGLTIPTDVGGGPHCHVGVNVEALWGAGKELVHHTDYTHGAPIIRAQLYAHDEL